MAAPFRPFYARIAALFLLGSAVALPFAPRLLRQAEAADPPAAGGMKPFAHWPQDRKPELVLVLTGQTFGYLSPCGCSRPQKGGLERRANFMDELRAKGWPVAGLDLGDIAPEKTGKDAITVPDQDRLKYRTAMQAMQAMGYAAVGVGENEFNLEFFKVCGEVLNDPHPVILAANLGGKGAKPGEVIPRATHFTIPGLDKPTVEDVAIVNKDRDGKPCLPFAVTGIIGTSVAEKIEKIDGTYAFAFTPKVIEECLAKIQASPAKPAISVLLYVGTPADAEKLAKAHPAFNLILCQIEESEPPSLPTMLNGGKTMLVQVGHKGQNVGVVGVYKTDAGYELKYQLVPLGEEYLTTPEKIKDNKVLQLLEKYTDEVHKKNLLAQFTAKPMLHPAMIQNPKANLTYIGVEKCITCHPQEGAVWKAAKHSQAYDALARAKNPGSRQFDGDCVGCHTTGFGYVSGFKDEQSTPNLLNNGCENCHGPGSGHAADPKDKALLAALTPWRKDPKDPTFRLPAKAVMEQLAKVKPGGQAPVQLTEHEQLTWNAVGSMCMKCHDGENDPKFDLNLYMPQIWHTGLKSAGLP